MQSFTLRPDSYAVYRKKMIKRMTVIGIIVVLILTGNICYTIYKTGISINSNNVFLFIPFLLPFVVVFFAMRSVIQRQKKLFETYRLTIDDLVITCEQYNTPNITMYLDEVEEITKFKNGSYIIRSKRMNDTIGVPSQINHYEKLEQSLNEIRPVSLKSKGVWTLYLRPLIFLLGIALLITVNAVDNKIVIVTAGILLTICFGLYMYLVQTNRNLNSQTRRSAWLALAMVCVEWYVIYIKLTV